MNAPETHEVRAVLDRNTLRVCLVADGITGSRSTCMEIVIAHLEPALRRPHPKGCKDARDVYRACRCTVQRRPLGEVESAKRDEIHDDREPRKP